MPDVVVLLRRGKLRARLAFLARFLDAIILCRRQRVFEQRENGSREETRQEKTKTPFQFNRNGNASS